MKLPGKILAGITAIAIAAGAFVYLRTETAPEVRFTRLSGGQFSTSELRVTPTTYSLDRQGRIVKQYLGEPDWTEFHALLEKVLSDPV